MKLRIIQQVGAPKFGLNQSFLNWDLYNWSEAIKQTLPSGAGSIAEKTLGTNNYLQIIVSFDDSRSNSDETPVRKQYTLLVERPTQLGGA